MKSAYPLFLLFFSLGLNSPHGFSQTYSWAQTNGPYDGQVWVMAANQDGTLYAATALGGVYRSFDAGLNWQNASRGLGSRKAISLLTTTPGSVFAGTIRGVYKTSDFGNNWYPSNVGIIDTVVRSLGRHPNGDIYAATDGGLFRSTNSGASWTHIDLGAGVQYTSGLAFNAAGHIYLCITTDRSAVFRSSDGGTTWQVVLDSVRFVNAMMVNRSQYVYVATDGGGLLRSTNNGITWTKCENGLTHQYIRSICLDSLGNVYAATGGGGFFRSTDNGELWSHSDEGITDRSVYSSTCSREGFLFVGTVMRGVFRSTNTGIAWQEVGLPNSAVTSIASKSANEIYASTLNGAICRTTDRGYTWQMWTPQTMFNRVTCVTLNPQGWIIATITPFDWDPGGIHISSNGGLTWNQYLPWSWLNTIATNSQGHIFAGGLGMVRSTDNGFTWASIDSGLPSSHISCLLIRPNSHLFVGTQFPGNGVFRSTNGGDTWTQTSIGLTNLTIEALATDSSGVLYGGSEGGGIFTSSDNGEHWLQTGLASPYEVLSLTTTRAGHIFAGTSGRGVLRSTDRGASWEPLGEGLIDSVILSLHIDPQGYVYAGTGSQGIFRSRFTTFMSPNHEQIPSSHRLAQNYPNPFNPSTTISYSLDKREYVRLDVYDLLGHECASLVDQTQDAGSYTVRWDGVGRPSGVYFYRLHARGSTSTRKMILLR